MTGVKFLLAISIATTTLLAIGQPNIDFRQLTKKWVQGKIDNDGKVIKREPNRGGWYYLNIKVDTTVIYNSPFECGFGYKQEGTWTLNLIDTTITFHYTKRYGYMNLPDTTEINEIEIYRIKKMNEEELILTKKGQETFGREIVLPLLSNNKLRE